MILLDTHTLIWYINRDERLSSDFRIAIDAHKQTGLAVSVITIWEIALLIEKKRLGLASSIDEWVNDVFRLPFITLLQFTPDIAIEATRLPGSFHKDPADRMLVATARAHDIPIATIDRRIIEYPYVKKV
jgi:PIN domain nuclease of toxin-antitoxin system